MSSVYTRLRNPQRVSGALTREDGYALPSILFLITILTLVAFSILLMQYLSRERALYDVARVKAEYAAESGVARLLGEEGDSTGGLFVRRSYLFDDGSTAEVFSQPWGVSCMVESRGHFRRLSDMRLATVGARPANAFQQAVVLGSSGHQLVFTGSASVRGDITVGSAGATTGSLHGYSTPASLPVVGRVTSGGSARGVPPLDQQRIKRITAYYEALLLHQVRGEAQSASFALGERVSLVPDSVDIAFFAGIPDFTPDSSWRRVRPLVVVASSGEISLPPLTHLKGPLTVVTGDSLTIGKACHLEHLVLYSARAIRVESSELASTQLLAPVIVMDSGAVGRYPSVVASLPSGERRAPLHQRIVLKGGSQVEGCVLLDSPFGDDLVTLEQSAIVTGALFSSARVTLDGVVRGTVIAQDFYFYEAPTIYLGWLRSGLVDRTRLPEGFLIPPLFAEHRALGVLEWL